MKCTASTIPILKKLTHFGWFITIGVLAIGNLHGVCVKFEVSVSSRVSVKSLTRPLISSHISQKATLMQLGLHKVVGIVAVS